MPIIDSIWRPAASRYLGEEGADWRRVMALLDDLGLFGVVDTRMELDDLPRLSRLASIPRKPDYLDDGFRKLGRSLEAAMAIVSRVRSEHGLTLLWDTEDGRRIATI